MISIISNDCWGNAWYKDNNYTYNTPLIGTFVPPRDFINLLEDFECIHNKLEFDNIMPVTGYLKNNVKIVFLHYPSIEIAQEKWGRRLSRMENTNKFVFKLSIMSNGIYKQYPTLNPQNIVDRFIKLPYENKLGFYTSDLISNDYRNDYIFKIDPNYASCALKLWAKTSEWKPISKMLK